MKAVFFYSEMPTKNPAGITDYLEVTNLTLPINRRYFDSSLVYTVAGTTIDKDIGFDTIIPLDVPERKLIHYTRVRSWLLYLESEHFDQDTVFLDADIIINRDIRHVFDHDFALAFSAYHSETSYSLINAGVFFAKHSRKGEAIQHMRKIVNGATQDRLNKDPRFPQYPCSGVWGLDEYCLKRYLEIISKKDLGINLKDFVLSLGLNEFRPLTQGITLFGFNYNLKVKNYDKSLWPKATIMHFSGLSAYNKPALIKEYLAEQKMD